jgi:DNA polymerase I-like protein with 3'-5' exonuclease and polymerase domains
MGGDKMTVAAVDIETRDPYLEKWGDGSIRNDGEVLGVGIYCPDRKIKGYFHPSDPVVDTILTDPFITKVFHNAMYDMAWLVNNLGYHVHGRIDDTLTQAYLLDAYAFSYSLESCCLREGVYGKNAAITIDEWWKNHGGKGKAVAHLKEIPIHVVAEYCLQDCQATYDLYMAQTPKIKAEGLERVNEIESRLVPVMMKMRKHGIAIDLQACMDLSDKLNNDLDEILQTSLRGITSLQSPTQLKKLFDHTGLMYPTDEDGKVSFAAPILAKIDHPVVKQLLDAKALYACLHKFVDGAFHDYSINGRLHPTIIPALRDDGGTVTGRMSSRDPNIQQVSAREEKFGKEVRSLFKPDENCHLFAYDYSQIEYRVYLNYAKGEEADELREAYQRNARTDYHQLTMDFMGWKGKEGRHIAKNCNFGSLYGLGAHSFATKFGMPSEMYTRFMEERTFIRLTNKAIETTAKKRGYVRTLLGRKQRWPLDDKGYKMVNYLVQGSAADILKAGLVEADRRGLWEVLLPSMPVHDEIVGSVPRTREGANALFELEESMLKLEPEMRVPLIVDEEIGPDWGHCDADNLHRFAEELDAREGS